MRQGRTCLFEQCRARRRQPVLAIAANNQGFADLGLEFLDRGRQWRLRHIQPLCRAMKMQFFGHHHELAQLSQFNHHRRTAQRVGPGAGA
jgi:hypothetical protein